MKGHRVLIVDDDPNIVATLVAIFKTAGHDPRVATNVMDALVAVEEEDYCLAVVDQQLPFQGGDPALAAGGPTVMRALRKKDKRHNDDDWHLLQIIALTGFSKASSFVTKVHQAGADAFMEKPLGTDASVQEFLALAQMCFDRAGRADHDRCAALAPAKVASSVQETVRETTARLVIDGRRHGRRSCIELDGNIVELQDAVFLFLLRLVAAHVRAPESWSTREQLGIGEQRHLVADVNAAAVKGSALGAKLVVGDGMRRFQLIPSVVVERVEWEKLLSHPDVGVQRVAKEMLARK